MTARRSAVLVDTHALLWSDTAVARLSDRAREILSSADRELLWSPVSSLEIAIKFRRGLLPLPAPSARAYVRSRIQEMRLTTLPVTQNHAFAVEDLPHHHGDPFDRLLVAQAIAEGVPILTRDRRLASYDVETIW